MDYQYFCTQCQIVYKKHHNKCYCGGIHTIIQVPIDCIDSQSSLRSAEDLCEEESDYEKIEGFDILGALPKNWTAMIFGAPGSGKSTFCMKLLSAIAKINTNRLVFYWSYEEGYGESYKGKLRNFVKNRKNFFISVANHFKDFLEEIRKTNPVAIAIDSINSVGLSGKEISFIKRNIEVPVIFICHITKDGKYKGDSDIGHETDINLKVNENQVVVATKNRFHLTNIKHKVFG